MVLFHWLVLPENQYNLLLVMMTKTKQFTDTELIQNIINGETGQFEILMRQNNALLYKTGRSYNYSHQDTLDLMQDTYIDAFSNLEKFEYRSSFKTWILRIMLNNCYRKQQKAGFKNETTVDITDSFMYSNKQHDDGNRSVINKELGHIIENALEKIPFDYRIVFLLREINGLSVEETSDVLKISQANVKTRLNRAKSMLRKEVEKTYTAEDIFEFNLVYCDEMVSKVMARIRSQEK